MKLFKLTNEEVVNENEKFFKFYVYLPLIIALITAASFLIWGIVDPIVFQHRDWGSYFSKYDYVYGVMEMDTFFGAMIVWWIIGIVATVMNYFTYKIILSPMILKILYLKKLLQGVGIVEVKTDNQPAIQTKKLSKKEKVVQELIQINKKLQQVKPVVNNNSTWICPKCGEKNNGGAKNCINCFTPKP